MGRILGERRLVQQRRVPRGCDELEPADQGPRHQGFELLDVGVEPEGAVARQDQLGDVARALGAGLMRDGGVRPNQRAQRIAARHSANQRFVAPLAVLQGGREAMDRRSLLSSERSSQGDKQIKE